MKVIITSFKRVHLKKLIYLVRTCSGVVKEKKWQLTTRREGSPGSYSGFSPG